MWGLNDEAIKETAKGQRLYDKSSETWLDMIPGPTDRAIVQATLRHVWEELQKHQRVTEEPGVMIYIPMKDWAELGKEVGL